MFNLFLHPVVALLITPVSSLPQSDDWNSLDLAKSANNIISQQPTFPLEPVKPSIINDNQKVAVQDLVASSTESDQADPTYDFIASNQEESATNLRLDELVGFMDNRDEETDRSLKTSQCIESDGNTIRKSKRSNFCPDTMPRIEPGERVIPNHDLIPKLHKQQPTRDPSRIQSSYNFCPPGFRAFCCKGPGREHLADGDAVEDCRDFITRKLCESPGDPNHPHTVECCNLPPLLYYDRMTQRSSYWAFACVPPQWTDPIPEETPSTPPDEPILEQHNGRPL